MEPWTQEEEESVRRWLSAPRTDARGEHARDLRRAFATLDRERAQAAALREALAGMLAWLDSEPVQMVLDLYSTIQYTQPHLTRPISAEFLAWAFNTIDAARAALAAPSGPTAMSPNVDTPESSPPAGRGLVGAVIAAAREFVAMEHAFTEASFRSGEGTVGGVLIHEWNAAKADLVAAVDALAREGA